MNINMKNIIGKYTNGNYNVILFEDGTKIRMNDKDSLIPATIESFDFKITNRCDIGCPMCHENSMPGGQHGDIMNFKFLSSLHPYTEIAIGGGNPLCHPQLEEFLVYCKQHKLIPNITVNQVHYEKEYDKLKSWADNNLIYGIGVSFVTYTDDFVAKLKSMPNAVLHVINGMISIENLRKLKNKGLKLLILGYKQVGRGRSLYNINTSNIEKRKEDLKSKLKEILENNWFNVVSFDNLALKQLCVKDVVSDSVWDNYYMGDDGIDGELTSATMFIDGVEGKFAVNSCAEERFPIMDTVEDMYTFLCKKFSGDVA